MNPKGNIPRSQKAITSLVNRYGNEVYEVLGLPVPEHDSLLDGLPEQVKSSLTPALKEINSIYARKKVSPDSPEAVKIAEEVFSKYGFNITSISNVVD